METLANLESFVRSAECGSFSAAARRLSLTPAAISRNVAQLETNLGVRLFQRSTRRLTLTEAGERFLGNVGGGLESIQAAITDLTTRTGASASDIGGVAGIFGWPIIAASARTASGVRSLGHAVGSERQGAQLDASEF